jgi:integrase
MSRKSSHRAGRVVRHVLADGTTREYRYSAYRRKRRKPAGDTLGDLIEAWEASPEWRAFAASTRDTYVRYTALLLGMKHVPVKSISRRDMIEQRNAVAKARGDGAASTAVGTWSAVFKWAVDNEWIEDGPMRRVRRLNGGEFPAWRMEEAHMAIQVLPEHLRRAVVLALYTGQRRGDLVSLPWIAYDGATIRLTQEKTSEPLVIPAHPVLKAELDAWRTGATATTILTNTHGRPWRAPNILSCALADALRLIPGFPLGRNIHGLRKLAAATLAEAGCSLKEIAAVTGHRSLAMLTLYTASAEQRRLAEAAILRFPRADLQTRTNAKKSAS